MKQGTLLTKLILLMLLLALIAYGVSAAISAMSETITTTTAIAYEVGDGFQATGFVVRDETVLTAPSGIHLLLQDEGARVAKGEALAATFADADAQEVQARIGELEQLLSRYETVLGVLPSVQGNAALDAQVQQTLLRFTAQTARGNLSAATENANTLKAFVLGRLLDDSGRAALQVQAQESRQELAALRTRLAGAVTQCTAQQAGFFSGSTDGYEALLTPNLILSLSPTDYETLDERSPEVPEGAIGRLIASSQWYFVCVARQENLTGCSVGDRLQVEFTADVYETLSMRIERISDPVDGAQVLVLSCDDYLAQISRLRTQTADIVLHAYQGLRVPKSAICFGGEDSVPGVYTLEGARARFKPVEILYETADFFLVRQDRSSIGHLWPGDEIILNTQNLEDGKVVI